MKEIWQSYIQLFSNENIAIRIITYSTTLATITFVINYIIKPIFSSVILKRNIIAERKIMKFAKQIENNSQRDRCFRLDEISELLNLPDDEAREVMVRCPKFKKLQTMPESWIRKKIYKPEDDEVYGQQLL